MGFRQFVRGMAASAVFITNAVLAAQAHALVPADSTRMETIQLQFRAVVGSKEFACGTSYARVGSTAATITPTDMRFYVHDVRLVKSNGEEVPLTLTQDSLWQVENIALLDFENGSGPCENGTPQTRSMIEGTAPSGEYVGARFLIGVPFERNHLDLATQPSPLSLTAMFWAWNSGHKFLRAEMRTGEKTFWMVHLGSTGCTPAGSASTVPTQCRSSNRPSVDLSGFTPASDVIVFDLAQLLAGANVEYNQPKTPAGCMSGTQDNDCVPLFAALGLPFRDKGASTQRVFRVDHGGATR